MTDLILCLRITKVTEIICGKDTIYVQIKPSNEKLFETSIHSEARKPPSTHEIKLNEDFVIKLPQTLQSFHVEISIKEKHTLKDKVLAHGKLELCEKLENFGKITEGSIKLKGCVAHYQFVVLEQPLPSHRIKEHGYHVAQPRMYLETGTVYYPGDTIKGFVALDSEDFEASTDSCIVFSTSSKGSTMDVVKRRAPISGMETNKYNDYRNYEVHHESSDLAPLFSENGPLPNSESVCIVPFSFKVPLSTPITIPDVPRNPYFDEKVGRATGEEIMGIAISWDTLPVAHTLVSANIAGKNKKRVELPQPLEIFHPEKKWLDVLPELQKMSEKLLESLHAKIIPSRACEHSDFIIPEITIPEYVRIGEPFKVHVKITSKLSKKLCNVEVRVGTAAEFTSKMVSINHHLTGIHKVENGSTLRSTDMSTAFRKTIPDFVVSEGETKEVDMEVTLNGQCFPTLMTSMYPLLHSWNWVEVSIQKGANDDDTYTGGYKYYVITQPLVVLPRRCDKPLPPTPETPIDAPSQDRLLTDIKVETPKSVSELPFMVPTRHGEAQCPLGTL
jgi:hypothetical protein